MIQAARIIGRGLATTGLRGAGVGIGVVSGAKIPNQKTHFSQSASLHVSNSDSSSEDSNNDIMRERGGSLDDFHAYFMEKETSIRRDYDTAISTGLDDKVSVDELQRWKADKRAALEVLAQQKFTLISLYGYRITAGNDTFNDLIDYDSETPPESPSDSGSGDGAASGSGSEGGTLSGSATGGGTGSGSAQPSSSGFQDSSDIERTDFTDYSDDLD